MPAPIAHRRLSWGWLIATWLACAGLIGLHTRAVQEYIAMLDSAHPASPAATPMQQVIPARYADAQMWVRHTTAAHAAGAARVRFTSIDNAPHGREVHWSSGFGWLLRASAAAEEGLTGRTGARAFEGALLWLNAPLLLLCVVALSACCARFAGTLAGVVVAWGMVGHPRFYEGFAPAYIDHHGVLTVAMLGLLLGVLGMNAGWLGAEPEGGPTTEAARRARHAALFSALCGAVGMWVSAAAMVPAIVLTGGAAAAISLWRGPVAAADGLSFQPGMWRQWGRVGAAASLVFYLFEYAPGHLGLRLEVNHPLHAVAWWGGAELIATVVAWRMAPPIGRPSLVPRLVVPIIALAAPLVTVVLAGRSAFMVGDPFIADLRHYVAEGRSVAATISRFGFKTIAYDVGVTVLVLAGLALTWRRAVKLHGALGTAFIVVAGFMVMAGFEMRWWSNVAAAEIAACALLATTVGTGSAARAAVLAVAALLFLVPAAHRIARDRSENRAQRVAEGDLLQPLYRDVAAALRSSQPTGDIVVLAGPNASAGVGYFGDFKTLGTLYWENAAGLRAAAELLSAETDEAAGRAARACGVTHIVMVSAANFVGEYFKLLHPARSAADAQGTFGYRLLRGDAVPPRWLQAIPYRCPPELARASGRVALFKVVADQSEPEHLYHLGLAHAARGEVDRAEKTLAQAAAQVPVNARASFFESAGTALYEYGADGAAVRLLRQSLEVRFDPAIANTAAWILATSRDAQVRDGRTALAFVEPILARSGDDPTVLSTYAAACAEAGRFHDAVRTAERALALVPPTGAGDMRAGLQRRLDAYRAGRPWRQ